MTDVELDALIEATYKVEEIAPGLLAWLDFACVWQLKRRNGFHYDLLPPKAAIPPEEVAISIEAAIALRVRFASTLAIRSMFDALVELLNCGGEPKKR